MTTTIMAFYGTGTMHKLQCLIIYGFFWVFELVLIFFRLLVPNNSNIIWSLPYSYIRLFDFLFNVFLLSKPIFVSYWFKIIFSVYSHPLLIFSSFCMCVCFMIQKIYLKLIFKFCVKGMWKKFISLRFWLVYLRILTWARHFEINQ